MLCLLTAHYSLGQSPGYRNYTVKDGLPSSEVYNCMQDSKGFMWFSTDRGVCRFDGYEFKTFTTSNGLADNTIFECKEDYKGRIWFRSLSGRLSYFYNDSIYRLPINDSLTKLIKTAFTVSFDIDTSDNIFIGLYGFTKGIIRINVKKNIISIIPLPFGLPYVLIIPGNKTITGYTIRSGSPASDTSPVNKFLHLYSVMKGDSAIREIRKWVRPVSESLLIHDQSIMLPDGRIALSLHSAFIVLDSTLSTFAFYKNLPSSIININEDQDHKIWVSTQSCPEYFSNNNFINKHLPSFIRNNHITSIVNDKEGGTWFTSLYGGVYYTGSLNFKTYSTDNGLPGNKITAITVGDDGAIWIASEHSNNFSVIHNDSLTYRKLPDIEGLSISNFFFTGNDIWITNNSATGLFVFKNDKQFTQIASFSGGIYTLIRDSLNSFWASAYSSVFQLKRENNKILVIQSKNTETKIFSICKMPDSSLYIGTIKGLFSYKNGTLINLGKTYSVLRNWVYDIKLSNNNVWIATKDTGIVLMHKNLIYHITTQNGLLSNFCQCVCVDYKNDVWVGTNKGISHIILNHLNSKKLIDTIINLASPNLIEVNKIVSKNDTIYAATNNGLTVFNLNKVSYNKIAPPIYITGLKINNKKWKITSALNLHYDENYFFISFVGITYKDAGNTQYRYKMEGIDTGWLYTKNRDVQYPKLAPGNYTFIVSAMNNDGIWNEKAASLQIKISPPFWATWWFRSLIIMGIAGFIYWRLKVIESRAKKQADINKQLITMELKELKAQMDPHFLFNNLNTLTHLVELKSDDAPEFVEELSKYYRYSLQFRNAEFTALENELKQAERYLHILRIRFGNNMHIKWNIQESLTSHYIATYSLQLLLENITKHNIVSSEKPLWVEIITTEQNSLIIRNQLQLKNSSALSNGHGLKSINQRYQLLTKRKPIISQTSQYFSVELPLITPEEYESIYS
ncbi:MAG TPA: histidine kinase [Bacteroidia bacterium]|nr:histidine kinase [Bacteroidia bacterium]